MNVVYFWFDALLVIGITTLITLLDRKYKQFRFKYTYRDKIWQHFLVNLVLVAAINIVLSLILGYKF